MIKSRLSGFYAKAKENIRAAIGWLIFVTLSIADISGHYIFDPFIFGFGYYVLYVFSRMMDADPELNKRRIIFIGGIAILYLWSALNAGIEVNRFIKSFERECSGVGYEKMSEETRELCEQIQSDIDVYIRKTGYDYE